MTAEYGPLVIDSVTCDRVRRAMNRLESALTLRNAVHRSHMGSFMWQLTIGLSKVLAAEAGRLRRPS